MNSWYILTKHFKDRYQQRVGPIENMQDDIVDAIRIGLKRKNIPASFKEKNLIGYNAIYYKGFKFIFSNSNFHRLITIIPLENTVLENLSKAKIKQSLYSQVFYTINNQLFNIIFWNEKVIYFKPTIKKEYRYRKCGFNFTLIINKIKDYHKSYKTTFSNNVDLTLFPKLERIVYDEILKIPYGKTISYKELATRLPFKISYQKILSIINNCPIFLMVPTHRIIRKDGKLGSFMLDVNIKKELLNIEKTGLEYGQYTPATIESFNMPLSKLKIFDEWINENDKED